MGDGGWKRGVGVAAFCLLVIAAKEPAISSRTLSVISPHPVASPLALLQSDLQAVNECGKPEIEDGVVRERLRLACRLQCGQTGP